jgi:molybdopterin synthase catalytic subunit
MARDWIEILSNGLPASEAIAFVTDPRAGGIDLFLGTTREEISSDSRQLVSLDYEAYTEMALDQLHQLAKRAREKWPVVKLAILPNWPRRHRRAERDHRGLNAAPCPGV